MNIIHKYLFKLQRLAEKADTSLICAVLINSKLLFFSYIGHINYFDFKYCEK